METLDQVKKYKELGRSMGDFILIMLSSIVAILFVYMGFDLYIAWGYSVPSDLLISGVELIFAILIFAAGLIAGILWVDRRARRVRVGEWKSAMEKDSTLGSVKLLSELDWPHVFQDIRYSKLGFVFYGILKIAGYWILVTILAILGVGVGLSFLHFQFSFTYIAIISLVLVLILSRNDLERRYNQAWALDSLLWELRWFDSEFRRKALFGADIAPET